MTTKIIGIKEFRNNITSLWREARLKNIRYIVMYHSKPILEINPINENDLFLENLINDVAEARKNIKDGKVYSEEEVYKKLGLK